jgi:AcrR family transcriptional regulator
VTEATAPRRSYPKGVRRRQQILDSVIAVLAQRGVDRASLRTVGEAIGVSHTALRHYFSSRDELLVEAYRAHEARGIEDARGAGEASGADPAAAGRKSAAGLLIEAAERNRAIPGLVELYATLTTDALQEQHVLTREFVQGRFRSLRALLAAASRPTSTRRTRPRWSSPPRTGSRCSGCSTRTRSTWAGRCRCSTGCFRPSLSLCPGDTFHWKVFLAGGRACRHHGPAGAGRPPPRSRWAGSPPPPGRPGCRRSRRT